MYMLARTGVLNQAVPGPLFADGMDVHGWRDSVSRVRGVDAAQAPRLDDRFSWPQVLVRRLLGKNNCASATVTCKSGHVGFPIALSFCFQFQGIACSGFTFYVQLWCTQKKGPVFVTMFDPLATIMAAMLAYFMFGENLYIGRYNLHNYINGIQLKSV